MKIRYGKIAVCSILLLASFGVQAEPEEWTFTDGATLVADLVTVSSGYAVLKDEGGKTYKIELDRFSEDSLTCLQLQNPPRLSLDLIKDRNTKVFSTGIDQETLRPPEQRNLYGIRIKQLSTGAYPHRLDVEVFIIGQERLGDKYILLDRFGSPFYLTEENRGTFELRSQRTVVLRNYYLLSGDRRGEDYFGHLAVVKDQRGETIAWSAARDWLFENIDNLRELQAGYYMDETCVRTYPTRPKLRGLK